MSILSTNYRLIKAGQDYSAGSGISIDDNVISVTGEFGKTYSAGDNISIYEQNEQLYISSKDWTNDIANASANAYNEAVAQIPDPFDPTFISAKVDNKLDTTAFTNWQNGQYSTDLQTIEGQISNKLDESAFGEVSGTFLTAINIPESAVWQDISTAVQTNSAQWAEGGGAISSYTTTWSHDVPPYGDHVINSLNEKYISAFISNSADKSKFANNANSANSANYAETVNETYLENKGFARNLTSEYGTISVIHNNIIESTNSAISRVGTEGFVSSFEGQSIGPEGNGTATYSWEKALPNTTINLTLGWSNMYTLTYSANTDLTGEIVLPQENSTQTINIPNATEFKVWSNGWIELVNAVVSAADQFETVVGELAWASALPTYEYDTNTNKISAINGSALVGGNTEVESYVVTNSASIDDTVNNVTTNSGAWGGSALPISAGPGISLSMIDGVLVISLA